MQPRVATALVHLALVPNVAYAMVIQHATAPHPLSAAPSARLNLRADSPVLLDADQPDESNVASLFASLRARQAELATAMDDRWRSAECAPRVGLVIDNWVRRLALEWPRAIVGTAQGALLLADLSTGEVVAKASRAHPDYVATPECERDMRRLFGEFDGGGILALELRGPTVVSAGRDGGAKMWRLARLSPDGPEELLPVAELHTAETDSPSSTVSAIAITGGTEAVDSGEASAAGEAIWVGSLDGFARRFEVRAPASSVADATESAVDCTATIEAAGPVLSMAVCEEAGLLALGISDGSVQLFTLTDGKPCGASWRPLGFDGSRGVRGEGTRSLAFVCFPGGQFALVAGGTEGAMHARLAWPVRGDAPDDDDTAAAAFRQDAPGTQLRPSHNGRVVALTPLPTNERMGNTLVSEPLLVSGAHDGTLRVWEMELVDGVPVVGARCLYGLGGFKVWLGSVATDGVRLVSDGKDNAIVVHDFSEEAVAKLRSESAGDSAGDAAGDS